MRRIGIIAFYDKNGYVDDFLYYLMDSLKVVLDELIFASNCSLKESTKRKLEKYVTRQFYRDDIGFDQGAWKDTLEKFCENENWNQWDEIVLMNDTFYGPFIDWKTIFNTMEGKNVDFWGLDEAIRKFDREIPFIVPYFTVISKRMFLDKAFKSFWETVDYPLEYAGGGSECFECSFTEYFQKRGFKYTTWLREHGGLKYISPNVAHQYKYSYELLKYCKLPVLKVKAISIFFYEESKKTLNYIKENTNYDTSLITKHNERLIDTNGICSYTHDTLCAFVQCHKNIYFLGHGLFANGLSKYFADQNWYIKGYIVSNPRTDNEKALDDFILNDDDGIIVAMGVMNLKEIYKKVKLKFPKKQLLIYSHRSLL